jgi:hypothetical protein
MIFLTLVPVNKFENFDFFMKKQFFYAFFFVTFFYLLFLDKNKKTLHNKFAFNNKVPWIEHIIEKNNTKKSTRAPQINQ